MSNLSTKGGPLRFPEIIRTSNIAQFLSVKNNVVKNHSTHCGTVIADCAIPLKCRFFYFEVIVETMERGTVVVGLTSEKRYSGAPLGKKDGYGLKTDGRVVSGENSSGTEWSHSRSWGDIGDVVGCGFIPSSGEIFFTQGTKFCGVAFRVSVKENDLTPSVSLGSHGQVKVNFGHDPFLFDVETRMTEWELERQIAIDKICVSSSLTQQLVREYLRYHGYGNTLQAFDKACNLEPPHPEEKNVPAQGLDDGEDRDNEEVGAVEVGQGVSFDEQFVAGSGIAHGLQSPGAGSAEDVVQEAWAASDTTLGTELPTRRRGSSLGSTTALSSSLSSLVSGFRRAAESSRQRRSSAGRYGSMWLLRGEAKGDDEGERGDDSSVSSEVSSRMKNSKDHRDKDKCDDVWISSLLNIDASGEGPGLGWVIRSTLPIRAHLRVLLKERDYNSVVAVLDEYHTSLPSSGHTLPLRESIVWVYIQCLLFIEHVRCGRSLEAIQLTATELLPLLQPREPACGNPGVGEVGVLKKRLREDGCESDSDLPDTSPHWSTLYCTAQEFSTMRRLVADVVGVLSECNPHEESTPDLGRALMSTACEFFYGDEFLDTVSDVVNRHVIESGTCLHHSEIPRYQTVLQLCAAHMNALKRQEGSHDMAWSEGDLYAWRQKYELNAVGWPGC